jgi:hypothetical protein
MGVYDYISHHLAPAAVASSATAAPSAGAAPPALAREAEAGDPAVVAARTPDPRRGGVGSRRERRGSFFLAAADGHRGTFGRNWPIPLIRKSGTVCARWRAAIAVIAGVPWASGWRFKSIGGSSTIVRLACPCPR